MDQIARNSEAIIVARLGAQAYQSSKVGWQEAIIWRVVHDEIVSSKYVKSYEDWL